MGDESRISRREFVVGAAAGVAGLAVGGAAGYVAAPNPSTSTSTTDTSKEAIPIGAAYPLTGPMAGDGQEMYRGAQLAVEEMNAWGGLFGRPVKLAVEDLEDMSTDKCVNAVERLISGKNSAAVFLSSMSYSNKEFDASARTGVPFFHMNVYHGNVDYVAENLDKYGMVFETCPTEEWYGTGFAGIVEMLESTKKWTPTKRTVAIVASNDPYSYSIAQRFQEGVTKQGYEVPIFEKFTAPQSEWGPVLARIRENPPGIVFFSDYLVADEATFTKQFMASPTPSLMYQHYAPSVPEYLDLVGEAGNGVLWSTMLAMLPDASGKAFSQRYEAKFGTKPGMCTAGAQRDHLLLWAEAALRAGDPRAYEKVVEQVRASAFRGICGSYTIDPKRNVCIEYPDQTQDAGLGSPLIAFQIQNGQHVIIAPSPWTQGEFISPSWI